MNKIKEVFEKQRKKQYEIALSTANERKQKLKKLKYAIEVTFRQAFRDAMKKDFHKSPQEVDLSEIYVLTSEIKHAIHHLGQWMQDKKVATPLAMMGSSSFIKYEPKGVCLIIAPWNFPINLTLGPLISAIAAGNTAILKPSEMTPNTSKVLKNLVESIFSEEEVALFEGGVEVSSELLALPFNHIFFTGSPAVGKIVMAAAAKNLSSVTLELGGKSPTIIDETADIKTSAKRIAWGKFFNSGQICIAPDYMLVHESISEAFIEEVKKVSNTFFSDKMEMSDDFTHIVNQKHATRINALIENAKNLGAKLLMGGEVNLAKNYVSPTILADIPEEAEILKEEIFGPVMPIITYKTNEEVVNYINKDEKPLALYIYSKNERNIEYFLNNTRSGGVCINNNAVHFFNNELPFGGSNNSGIGKSHGFFGFQEFSNAKGVLRQHLPGALELLMPPYTNFKTKLIELTIKWF
jgi:aldehyde dehydrogenase (NAD+)